MGLGGRGGGVCVSAGMLPGKGCVLLRAPD